MVQLHSSIGHTDIYRTKFSNGSFEHVFHIFLLTHIAFYYYSTTTFRIFDNPIRYLLGFFLTTMVIHYDIRTLHTH
eukprot:m.473446 g.473446  ORF g.473446 m.473446 type:complete len:76 (-) comp34365_c0_seq1:66-293(-)